MYLLRVWRRLQTLIDFECTSSAHSESDDVFPREKQQDTEWRYDRLQRLMESVWRSMFSEPCPRTVLFSFRDYGLTTQSSYWYYALKIHEHLSAYGKVFRIKFRQHLCECGLAAWWERNDQLKLNMLK